MVGILKRMRKLNTLLDIRLGPGAAILPKDVQRIHLNFARKINDGHMGPRKFWHMYLPRLKYHNPAVPMTVERTGDQEGPASLTVFFASPSSSSSTGLNTPTMSTSGDKTPSDQHSHFETTKSINMKHKHESKILEELMALVQAKQVEPTTQEVEQLKELEEESKRSEQDRVAQAEVLASKKRQANILAQARNSVDAQTGTV